MRVGILTVSDKGSIGERVDTAGPAVAELVRRLDAEVVERQVIADERQPIAGLLRTWADDAKLDLILTTGGTGLAPRDVTPEATLDVAERMVPGIAEAMRQVGRESTPLASLSRAVVVSRGHTLIVNLPGSEKGARESLAAILDLLPHANLMLGGYSEHEPTTSEHGPPTSKDGPPSMGGTGEHDLPTSNKNGPPPMGGTGEHDLPTSNKDDPPPMGGTG